MATRRACPSIPTSASHAVGFPIGGARTANHNQLRDGAPSSSVPAMADSPDSPPSRVEWRESNEGPGSPVSATVGPSVRKATAMPFPDPTQATVNPDRAVACLVAVVADAVANRVGDRDELVALAPKPLAAMGLEHAAVARLVAEGRLRAVTIGRRRFTKRSYLLALVDELPTPKRAPAPAVEQDALREAVTAMARRSARKRMRAVNRGGRGSV